MFIMSQDKEDFINLDNVKMVTVDENIVGIDVNFAEADFYEIGAYESKERALEVLQEIVKQKAMFELFRTAPTGGREQTEMLERFAQKKIILDTYEMPEE